MTRHPVRRERGQIVPVVALLMIVIVGFAAIVIDGGRGYVDRRDLQASADAAALSGAGRLGARLPTSFDLSCAVAAAVYQAVQDLPGTSTPAGYGFGGGGSCPSLGHTFQFPQTTLGLGNGYSMDISANVEQVTVTLHHTLSLTFGIAAGFGPSMSPAATATAENGGLPFALVLFRTNTNGSAKEADLTFSGSNTKLCVVPKGTACSAGPFLPGLFGGTHANALTNESLCPPPGNVDFRGTGDMYAFFWPLYPSNCAAGGANVLNTFSGLSDLDFPLQLVDPKYPEPSAGAAPSGQSGCSGTPNPTCIITSTVECLQPGTYDTIDVHNGSTLVLLPGVFKIADSTGNNSSGLLVRGGASVVTADLVTSSQLSSAVGCASLGGSPAAAGSASAVAIEMTPQGADGSNNQVNVNGNISIHSAPKYANISIYVEHGDPCTAYTTAGCGSNVINFASSSATYSVQGVIYGYADNMKFAGGSGGQGIGQAFAWTMFVNGGGSLTETYDPGSIPFLQGLLN